MEESDIGPDVELSDDETETDGGRDDDTESPDDVSWLDAASQEHDEVQVEQYDVVSAPNDWNIATIVSFMTAGAVTIPAFQRNYVWDRKRASKLIESLLLGLPVPQVFLYEQGANSFLVIDGQQRLLTLFFFAKGRFPRPKARSAIRSILNERKGIEERDLHDESLFENFRLALPRTATGQPNQFNGMSYKTLGDFRTTFDLRTLRNVVVKQTSPDGDAAMFEIFSRLNAGGVNLSPQEIRASLYHSPLMGKMQELNRDERWRRLLGVEPDPRMRDIELLIRSLALARDGASYSGSMTSFVNQFCKVTQSLTAEQADSAIRDFGEFLDMTAELPAAAFRRGSKFSGVLFEALFAGWIAGDKSTTMTEEIIAAVRDDPDFAGSLQEGSTKKVNVQTRLGLAAAAFGS
jgi:hypothetical protein